MAEQQSAPDASFRDNYALFGMPPNLPARYPDTPVDLLAAQPAAPSPDAYLADDKLMGTRAWDQPSPTPLDQTLERTWTALPERKFNAGLLVIRTNLEAAAIRIQGAGCEEVLSVQARRTDGVVAGTEMGKLPRDNLADQLFTLDFGGTALAGIRLAVGIGGQYPVIGGIRALAWQPPHATRGRRVSILFP